MFEWLKDFANNYGTLINILYGGVAILLTFLFGGKLFYVLAQRRIDHLEEQLDQKSKELDQRTQQLGASRTELSKVKLLAGVLDGKLNLISTAFDGGSQNLWLRQPTDGDRPNDYAEKIQEGIPIVLIANLKGGVGKTTLAANLAAYFEEKHDERVLAIDLDYQGSLSSMLLPENANRKSRDRRTLEQLIDGSADKNATLAHSKPIRGSKLDSRIIECDDPFANFETRLLIEWLMGATKGDIRYNLARALCSKEVQGEFKRVIIDAPPRLTTGFVNALCASTHLVVPFVLDILSAERVGLFLGSVKQMKPKLFPHLELAAVIGTMKGDGSQRLRETEAKALDEAKRRVKDVWKHGDDFVLDKLLVPRKQPFADAAGISIAYYESDEVKAIIDPIGDVIFNRTRRETLRYENQRIEEGTRELRSSPADIGVEPVQ